MPSLKGMKTAISIPDDVFEGAERLALLTEKSRSQLFSDAVRDRNPSVRRGQKQAGHAAGAYREAFSQVPTGTVAKEVITERVKIQRMLCFETQYWTDGGRALIAAH